MTTTEFSEFSFGYALIDSIMHGGFDVEAMAPTFLNQRQEGNDGGGYDVKIPLRPVPLFLQFKVPQILNRWGKNKPLNFSLPYYKIHLRTNQNRHQHNLLVDLAKHCKQPLSVLYAAPEFDSIKELDFYYSSRLITEHTAFFSPLDIGNLDNKSHHIAYHSDISYAYLYSEPTLLRKRLSNDIKQVLCQMCKDANATNADQFITNTLESLVELISNYGYYRLIDEATFREKLRLPQIDTLSNYYAYRVKIEVGEKTVQRIAYLARTYLGCEFFILSAPK